MTQQHAPSKYQLPSILRFRWLAVPVFLASIVTACVNLGSVPAGAASYSGSSVAPASTSLVTTPSTPCTVSLNTPTCTSSNSTLTVDGVFSGNASGCVFTWSFNWGDGTTQTVQFAGQSASGLYFLASHTYASSRPVTYAVSATAISVTPPCTILSGSYAFSYVPFSVTTTSLPDAVPGQAYGPVTLQATGITASGNGFTTTLKWSKVALPRGLKLSSSGVISGTPKMKLVAGTSDATVKVTETVSNLNGNQKIKTKTSVEATIPLTVT